jgi:hypothetical protein
MSMAEPKPFASLTPSLLARKGGAKPAMRRQMMGSLSSIHGPDDLGWNDMGDDVAHVSDPLSVAGLTPMPQHGVQPVPQTVPQPVDEQFEAPADLPPPPVVEQQRVLEERVTATVEQASVVPEQPEPSIAAAAPVALLRNPSSLPRAKAAFTLRLDAERHLRLRLACALDRRSAQHIVTEALDAFLAGKPELESLAEQAAHAARNKD